MTASIDVDNSQSKDDWRLQVDFEAGDPARAMAGILAAQELEHDLSRAFDDRVIVSQESTRVFVYAGTRQQCERARSAIETLAHRQSWAIQIDFRRWHPLAEDWEDARISLPKDHDDIQRERRVLMDREQGETKERGYPEFEVRVDLPSHHDAKRLADLLASKKFPTVRRWRYLVVGVTDEVTGEELVKRMEADAPRGSHARLEGTVAAVHNDLSNSHNPFAVISENNS